MRILKETKKKRLRRSDTEEATQTQKKNASQKKRLRRSDTEEATQTQKKKATTKAKATQKKKTSRTRPYSR